MASVQPTAKRHVTDETSAASPARKRSRQSNLRSSSTTSDAAIQRTYKIPIVKAANNGRFSWNTFLREYETSAAVLLKSFHDTRSFGLRNVRDVFARSASAKTTWCKENKSRARANMNWLDSANQAVGDRWYASFILQDDQKLLENVIHSLPLGELTNQHPNFAKRSTETKSTWSHANTVWFFVGSNTKPDATPMKGRKEHTDSITHDGTW